MASDFWDKDIKAVKVCVSQQFFLLASMDLSNTLWAWPVISDKGQLDKIMCAYISTEVANHELNRTKSDIAKATV